MFLVILNSNPTFSSLYEQGISMALNLADAECDEIKVFLEGDFFETLCVQSPQSKLVKMLLQLELYDVCIYGKESYNLGRLEVIREEKPNLVLSADKVVVF